MKYFMLFGALIYLCFMNACQSQPTQPTMVEETTHDSRAFDEELAKKLGADDYGMASYIMAFLKKGPNRPQDSIESAKLQSAHLENIGRLADEGKLVLAGPFLDDGDLRGIYIFDVQTIEEARLLTESDPAILAGSIEMELIPWYGSAAVKQISEIHERISKIKF